MSLRSPLGRVLGLGSAKDGTGHWWAQRVTSIALIPLTLWFFFSLLLLPGLDYGTVKTWLAVPISSPSGPAMTAPAIRPTPASEPISTLSMGLGVTPRTRPS